MAMNPFERVKDGTLYPPFREKLVELFRLLADDGYFYVITSGLRTYAEQDSLYAIGRSKPGNKVTNAKAGYSWHNFGIATDSCVDLDPDKPGLQPSWDDKYMKRLADKARSIGLEAGYYWKSFPDGPHVQLPLAAKGITLADLREQYDEGGIKQVWAFLDSKGPW